MYSKSYIDQLGKIADAIGGDVWNSGGGIFGVLVREYIGIEFFFGFAEDVLGWDITDEHGHLLDIEIPNEQGLTIDQTEAVIDVCFSVIKRGLHYIANVDKRNLRGGSPIHRNVSP